MAIFSAEKYEKSQQWKVILTLAPET
jgi:hypothetical protein